MLQLFVMYISGIYATFKYTVGYSAVHRLGRGRVRLWFDLILAGFSALCGAVCTVQ